MIKQITYTILFSLIILCGCNNNQEQSPEKKKAYSEVKKQHEDELLEWNKKIVDIDHTVIQKFIERRKWDMNISPTGLYYQILNNNNNTKAIKDNTAEFTFKTYLLNGTTLYSSQESGNRFFKLGHNQTEQGLNEGLLMMRKGEKARFITPPHLAFGVAGDGHRVPAYSILVYEIELIDLK